MPKHQEVHLYTLCWNDRRMLPHFFRHYGAVVDRFFIFDNGSTDGSLEMLAGDERVQVSHFETEFDSFVDTELRLSEEVWKQSRGAADWVFVIDIDEHIYHEDLRAYLSLCTERNVTAIQAIGYEMVSEAFPDASRRLCDVVTTGVRFPKFHDKLCAFDPSAITRTNFAPGRHSASPEGCVRWPPIREVLLLHYKKLGLEYEIARSAELRKGLGSRDKEKMAGGRYFLSPEEIADRFKQMADLARPVPRTASEAWQVELDRLKDAVTSHAADNQQLARETARLRHDLANRETQYRNLEARMAELSADLSEAQRELPSVREQLVEAERAHCRTAEDLQKILRSRSWKITKALRSLYEYLGHPFRPSIPSVKTPSRIESERPPPPITTTRKAPLFLVKQQLETAMCSEPTNWTLRREYFEVLERISNAHLGCFYAWLPDIATPLMLRASTSDIWNLRQIFFKGDEPAAPYKYGDYGFEIPPVRRILDLGAYCGYAAIYFANRFPDAEITCVEPPGANFDALQVNTAPYANIFRVAAAVWRERTVLQSSGHVLGDWGTQFTPGAPTHDAVVEGFTISDILALRGWDSVDFIKCIVEGSQVDILTQAERPWARRVLLVTTKPTPGGVWANPDDEARLLAAYPDDAFEQIRNQNMILAFRRRSDPNSGRAPAPQPLPLIPVSPGLRSIEPVNVNGRFGFYKFGDAGINLVLNPAEAPPASFNCRLQFDRHRAFLARIIAGPSASASAEATITLRVRDPASAIALIDERCSLTRDTELPWRVEFAPLTGPHDVTISVEPTGSHPSDQRIPWLHIVDARFL